MFRREYKLLKDYINRMLYGMQNKKVFIYLKKLVPTLIHKSKVQKYSDNIFNYFIREASAKYNVDKIFNVNELTEYLKIKKNTLYIWVSQRKIPFVKVGRRTLFIKKEIDRWVFESLVREKDYSI